MGADLAGRRRVPLFACEGVDDHAWREELPALPPELEVRFWPDTGVRGEVDYGFASGNPGGFWRHPRITVTPHAAAFTHPGTAVPALAENLRRLMSGAEVVGLVDRRLAYLT